MQNFKLETAREESSALTDDTEDVMDLNEVAI